MHSPVDFYCVLGLWQLLEPYSCLVSTLAVVRCDVQNWGIVALKAAPSVKSTNNQSRISGPLMELADGRQPMPCEEVSRNSI